MYYDTEKRRQQADSLQGLLTGITMRINSGCISDRGNYREKNQDRAVCHCRGRGKAPFAVACICDGIGSFEQSEIAAEMVTDGITRWFTGIEAYYPKIMGGEDLAEDLEETIKELNELACDYRREREIDIGCTMSVLLLTEKAYYIFHVGDSRIFRVQGVLHQLTRDEVWMEEKDGRVKACLANYVGKAKELWINKLSGAMGDENLFLLGSDGLFRKLRDEDVAGLSGRLKSNRLVQGVCRSLVKLVLERGERDNVSCILINTVTGN